MGAAVQEVPSSAEASNNTESSRSLPSSWLSPLAEGSPSEQSVDGGSALGPAGALELPARHGHSEMDIGSSGRPGGDVGGLADGSGTLGRASDNLCGPAVGHLAQESAEGASTRASLRDALQGLPLGELEELWSACAAFVPSVASVDSCLLHGPEGDCTGTTESLASQNSARRASLRDSLCGLSDRQLEELVAKHREVQPDAFAEGMEDETGVLTGHCSARPLARFIAHLTHSQRQAGLRCLEAVEESPREKEADEDKGAASRWLRHLSIIAQPSSGRQSVKAEDEGISGEGGQAGTVSSSFYFDGQLQETDLEHQTETLDRHSFGRRPPSVRAAAEKVAQGDPMDAGRSSRDLAKEELEVSVATPSMGGFDAGEQPRRGSAVFDVDLCFDSIDTSPFHAASVGDAALAAPSSRRRAQPRRESLSKTLRRLQRGLGDAATKLRHQRAQVALRREQRRVDDTSLREECELHKARAHELWEEHRGLTQRLLDGSLAAASATATAATAIAGTRALRAVGVLNAGRVGSAGIASPRSPPTSPRSPAPLPTRSPPRSPPHSPPRSPQHSPPRAPPFPPLRPAPQGRA